MRSVLIALSGSMIVACDQSAAQMPDSSYQSAYQEYQSEMQEIGRQLGDYSPLPRLILIQYARYGAYARQCDMLYGEYYAERGFSQKAENIPNFDPVAFELLNQAYRKTYNYYTELAIPTWPTPDSCQALYEQYEESSNALDTALCAFSTLSEEQLQSLYDQGMNHVCT